MTKNVTAGKIYITAFLDFKTFKNFADIIAWETEIWIANMPEHMLHFNGDRFLGPQWFIRVMYFSILFYWQDILQYYNK